ncbi:MAG: hypothetical protein ABII06_06260 [Pseudomonadota bacterium]
MTRTKERKTPKKAVLAYCSQRLGLPRWNRTGKRLKIARGIGRLVGHVRFIHIGLARDLQSNYPDQGKQ